MSGRDRPLYTAAAMTGFTLAIVLLDWLLVFSGIFRTALFLLVLGAWIGAVVYSAAFPEGLEADYDSVSTDVHKRA